MTMPHRVQNFHEAFTYIVHVATDPVAVAASASMAASSPWWLPWLADIHDMATQLLPIVGCTLGSLQIILLIAKQFGWVKG